MIIDGTNLILGRLASFTAKRAMQGEEIIIVNSEKVVISGKKDNIYSKYKVKSDRGNTLKGPFFPRLADRLVRRTIRGMLPYKQSKGKKAFERVMCYLGVPEKYKNEKIETVNEINFNKLKTARFIRLDKLTGLLK